MAQYSQTGQNITLKQEKRGKFVLQVIVKLIRVNTHTTGRSCVLLLEWQDCRAPLTLCARQSLSVKLFSYYKSCFSSLRYLSIRASMSASFSGSGASFFLPAITTIIPVTTTASPIHFRHSITCGILLQKTS